MIKKELQQELNRTKLVLDYARQEIEKKDKEIEEHKNTIATQEQEIERLNNIINKGINECEKSAHDIWEVEGAYSNWFLEIKDILKGSEQE